MEQKYYELFKLQYDKLLNSSQIVYKTIASYNNMAFSYKEMVKEMELFVQAVLLNKALKTNQLDQELIIQFSNIFEYGSILKSLKYKPKKPFDEKVINNIEKYCEEQFLIHPRFIKLGVYFDESTTKYNLGDKVSFINIILKVISSMMALIENIDDQNISLSHYESFLKVINSYIKG